MMNNHMELPLSGLEPTLTEMEQAIQETTHRFAQEVLRPAGIALDKLSAEAMVAADSQLWEVLQRSNELGLNLTEMAELEPLERVRLLAIASEELAWGDAGLAGAILVNHFPVMYSLMAGNQEMAEYCEGKRGCWAITEPDHGSDMCDANASCQADSSAYGRPNCIARIEGDKVVINGQKSAWVSGAITAEVCALYCHADVDGEIVPGISVIVPLDTDGVSRGKPLDKLGLRCLNQGELYFDNVEVPVSHILAGPDTYKEFTYLTLAEANPHVALMLLGTARAAYEHALEYAHERKQGGVPIIQHQNVRYRLFHMFRKVEAARALVRRTIEYNATAPRAALHGSTAAKITATDTAFEVASEALQIFGGNGLTKEYPMEKLLRDARAGMIADGCNEFLALKGGSMLLNPDLI
jgi:alkylation response protein AidB-like acyl-CoA dehydrogenase